MKKVRTSPISSDELVFLYDNFGAEVSVPVQERVDEILGRLSKHLFDSDLETLVEKVHNYTKKQPNAVID